MAVCALAANADNDVSPPERYSIDHILANDPALRALDQRKAIDTLDDYLVALRREGESAKEVLYNKIRRVAGDHKRVRTLMRVAFLIIVADRKIRDEEKQEFIRLCEILDLEPGQVWRELAA
jgi:tellurite resistance protein